ncbi:MAG: restriction endonuclease subunit S [Gallionella sp.]|nr:restriction endonuclease subunit S [Gallionella sp.]
MTVGKIAPLDDVCNVEYGTRVVQKRDGGSVYPVYGGGGATFKMDSFNREDRLVISRFGMSEECTRFVAGKFFLNDSGLTISPRDGTLLQRFVDYQMLSLNDEIFSLGKGSAQKNLDVPAFRTIPVFVPIEIEAQQLIVGILDEAFDGIATAKATAEQNLQNARALFESHLQSVFTQRGEGWVEKPLAELCDPNRVITYGVIKLGDEVPEGVPCLRTSNVRWLRIETEGMKRIAQSLSSEYSRTILKGGEVLVNVRGTLGGVAVASKEMTGWNVSREVAVVPIDSSRINPVFLSYLIGSGVSQQWLGGVKKGAAYVGINIEDLRLLPVCAPKLEKQLEVVRHLEQVHEETQRLEYLYQRKLAALDELKKSLLHQAFSGAL